MPGASSLLRNSPSGHGSFRLVAALAVGCALSSVVASAEAADSVSPDSRSPRARYFGGMADVGFPEGAGLSLVARPAPWVRFHAGGTFNAFAPGFRGGVTFDPMPTQVGVTGTLEAGRVIAGDYSALSRTEGAYLKRLSYDYANLHLGLEVGNRDVFRLFLRGGVTLATASLGVTLATASLGELSTPLSQQQQDTTISSTDAKVGVSPFFSGKAGAAVFF